MTTEAIQIPWAPGAIFTKLLCRLGEPSPDAVDSDENMDLKTQTGTVTLTCNAPLIRYTEADGRSRMLTSKPMTFSIRPSDGELFNSSSGVVGVSVLSASTPGLDPTGFTWTAVVKPLTGLPWTCVVPPDAGVIYDLVSGADIAETSPGVSTLTSRVAALETEVDSLLSAPPGSADLSNYYTKPQVDTALNTKENSGAASTSMTTHLNDPNPHPQYTPYPDMQTINIGANTVLSRNNFGLIPWPINSPVGFYLISSGPYTVSLDSTLTDVDSAFPWVSTAGERLIFGIISERVYHIESIPFTDVSNPTAGTLASSTVTSSGFTLTVTGASDETALAAAPYSFNIGSGWSAYQASNVYVASGLSGNTQYTSQHKVKDASGNETSGSSIIVQTLVSADNTAPTAPALSVNNSSQTQLVVTVTGGTDAIGVTQRRIRISAGAWEVLIDPVTTQTITGLTANTSYTIDAQAGDAAGNWSVSTSWTGSTASASALPDAVSDLWAWYDSSDASTITSSSGVVSAWASKNTGANGSTVGGSKPLLNNKTGTVTTGVHTINGLNGIEITGGSKIGNSTFFSPSGAPLGQTLSVLSVYKMLGSYSAITNWSAVDIGGLRIIGGYSDWRVDTLRAVYGGPGTTRNGGDLLVLHTGTYNTGVAKASRSNIPAIPDSSGLSTFDSTAYWQNLMGGASGTTGIVHCETVIYSKVLTQAEINSVSTYLKAKWGVS